jgi:co-chaperonin GroES (HSP10)
MKALNNQVVIKPREDLEDRWGGMIRVNKASGFLEPRPVYGEIMSVGPGDQLHPDIPDLKKGDLVVWNLSKIGPPVIEHGATLFLNSFDCLLARIHEPNTDQESYTALLDMVLTEDAPIAMAHSISPTLASLGANFLPDTVARDGLKESPGDCAVTTVYERVVTTGRGITFAGRNTCACCKERLQRTEVPEMKAGDLVVFNPSYSIPWRRRGRNYRFTPASEIRGIAED